MIKRNNEGKKELQELQEFRSCRMRHGRREAPSEPRYGASTLACARRFPIASLDEIADHSGTIPINFAFPEEEVSKPSRLTLLKITIAKLR
jgi:hypothetical protein